jgi:hypothetical protein
MSPVQKAQQSGKTRTDAYLAAIRKYKIPATAQDIATIKGAVARQTARDANLARLGIQKGQKHKGWQRKALVAEVNLAQRRGWLPPGTEDVAKQVIAQAATLPMWSPDPNVASVSKLRSELDDAVFQGNVTSEFEKHLHQVAGHR